MDKKMEQMISRDLGVEINEIRKSPWNQLDKIHTIEDIIIELRSIYRCVVCKYKCVLKTDK